MQGHNFQKGNVEKVLQMKGKVLKTIMYEWEVKKDMAFNENKSIIMTHLFFFFTHFGLNFF